MQLSEHLSLVEVTNSENAKRLGVSNQPTPEHLKALKLLAENIFEPIRKHFKKPIYISSGYRSKALNDATPNSSPTSQHCLGEALDLDQDGRGTGVTNKMVFDYIRNNLNFDQLINEFDYSWVHCSFTSKDNRNEIKIATKGVDGKTIYTKYIT